MKYVVKHYYQPTNNSCSQAALATLLSYFDEDITPEEIMKSVPVNKNDKGEDIGTLNQDLAVWCLASGFEVKMYTADFQIIDLSWANLDKDKLLERLEKVKPVRNVQSIGKQFSELYVQSYINFIKAGGELHIIPFMSTKLIDELLIDGPLLGCVAFSVLYGSGRGTDVALRKSEPDDINGKTLNHTIVIYGKDEDDNYLVADPWKEPGLHSIEPERLLAAMTASQIECDNLIFQLSKA